MKSKKPFSPLVEYCENNVRIWWFSPNTLLPWLFPGWRGGPAGKRSHLFLLPQLSNQLHFAERCYQHSLWPWWGLQRIRGTPPPPPPPEIACQAFACQCAWYTDVGCKHLSALYSIPHTECYLSCHERGHPCMMAGSFESQHKPQMDLPPLLNSSSSADSLPGEIPWA